MPQPRPAPNAGAGTRRSRDGKLTPSGSPAPAPLLSARCDPRQWGRTIHTAPPATACWDVSGSVLICAGQARARGFDDVSMAGGTDIFGGPRPAGGAWGAGGRG